MTKSIQDRASLEEILYAAAGAETGIAVTILSGTFDQARQALSSPRAALDDPSLSGLKISPSRVSATELWITKHES